MVFQCKYQSDEERNKAYKEQQNNYAMRDWKCDVCNIEIKLGNKTKHLNTKKHIQNVSHENCEKTWKCDVCNIVINIYSKENHLKSSRHRKNMDRQSHQEGHDNDSTCSTCDEDE